MLYELVVNYLTQPSLSTEEVQKLNIRTLAKLNGFSFFPFATQPVETKDYSKWWPTILHAFFPAPSSTYLLKLINVESSELENKRLKNGSSPMKAQAP